MVGPTHRAVPRGISSRLAHWSHTDATWCKTRVCTYRSVIITATGTQANFDQGPCCRLPQQHGNVAARSDTVKETGSCLNAARRS